jgi:hypothetical protein
MGEPPETSQTLRMTHHGADLARQSKSAELAVVHAVLVQVANIQLDTGMVLGCNQLVGPRAAKATTKIQDYQYLQQVVASLSGGQSKDRKLDAPLARDVQIHSLASVVNHLDRLRGKDS